MAILLSMDRLTRREKIVLFFVVLLLAIGSVTKFCRTAHSPARNAPGGMPPATVASQPSRP